MKSVLWVLLGIFSILFGLLIVLMLLLSESNVFVSTLQIIKGSQLDFGWYDYSYYGTKIFLNVAFFFIAYFLIKIGVKIIKSS
jgi:hypothetical protein